MNVTKEDLSIFTTAVAEIRTEGRVEGLTLTIINLRREMGLSIEQIANLTGSTTAFVKAILDKVE